MATKKRWSAKVDTDSTHPEEGLFTKSPTTIAKSLASKKVSPKGPASGMRMLTFYINRAGKNLPEDRKAALEKAKSILSGIIARQKRSSVEHSSEKKARTGQTTSRKASHP
ncbi:MAG TPA: DUF3175 domain-containing protein, partial [Edaphobacter sp.]|nr:DUF3175 domain-containing protein [Edaphobacter sp.]